MSCAHGSYTFSCFCTCFLVRSQSASSPNATVRALVSRRPARVHGATPCRTALHMMTLSAAHSPNHCHAFPSRSSIKTSSNAGLALRTRPCNHSITSSTAPLEVDSPAGRNSGTTRGTSCSSFIPRIDRVIVAISPDAFILRLRAYPVSSSVAGS